MIHLSTFEKQKTCACCDEQYVIDLREAALLSWKDLITLPIVQTPLIATGHYIDMPCVVRQTQDQEGQIKGVQFHPVHTDVSNSQLKPYIAMVRFKACIYESGDPVVLAHCLPETASGDEAESLRSLIEALQVTPGVRFELDFDYDAQRYSGKELEEPYNGDLVDRAWLKRALMVALAGQRIVPANVNDFCRALEVLEKAKTKAMTNRVGHRDVLIRAA